MLWGVRCVSTDKIESETLQIPHLNGNYLTALFQHLKISSINKTSHADFGEGLGHNILCLNIYNSDNGECLTCIVTKNFIMLTFQIVWKAISDTSGL